MIYDDYGTHSSNWTQPSISERTRKLINKYRLNEINVKNTLFIVFAVL